MLRTVYQNSIKKIKINPTLRYLSTNNETLGLSKVIKEDERLNTMIQFSNINNRMDNLRSEVMEIKRIQNNLVDKIKIMEEDIKKQSQNNVKQNEEQEKSDIFFFVIVLSVSLSMFSVLAPGLK